MSVAGNRVCISGADSIKRKEIELYSGDPCIRLFFCDDFSAAGKIDLLVTAADRASESLSETLCPVICYGKAEYMAVCLSAGCSDYLCTPWSSAELYARIRRCLRAGRIGVEGFELYCGDDHRLRLTGKGKSFEMILSASDAALFRFMAGCSGSYVDRETLCGAAGLGWRDGSRAVDMHISRIRSGIDGLLNDAGLDRQSWKLLRTATRRGWGLFSL